MLKTLILRSAFTAAFCSACFALGAHAQTVLVNYDFATAVPGSECVAEALTTAPNVTAHFSVNTGTCSTPTGVETISPPAFAGNASNQAVSIQNSDITPAHFQFELSGPNLVYYSGYKVHLQAQRSGKAQITGALQFSTDGVNFTDFQTFEVTSEFTPFSFDLSSGASEEALRQSATVFIRVVGRTDGRSSGNFRLDNFQVQGQWQSGPTAATASISGRVVNSRGIGHRSVTVILTGGDLLEPLYARSSSSGYFEFPDLPTGRTYVLAVSSGRYIFDSPTMVVNLNDSFSEAYFISEEWDFPAAREPAPSAGKIARKAESK